MSNFAVRFKELRKDKGKTQKEVADYLGKTDALISKYENGKAVPEFQLLIELADYFNVSLDYLVGRSDNNDKVVINNDSENDFSDFFDLLKNVPVSEPKIHLELSKLNMDVEIADSRKILYYLDFLGINLHRVLRTIYKESIVDDKLFFKTNADSLQFRITEASKLAVELTKKINEFKEESYKNPDGSTNYIL